MSSDGVHRSPLAGPVRVSEVNALESGHIESRKADMLFLLQCCLFVVGCGHIAQSRRSSCLSCFVGSCNFSFWMHRHSIRSFRFFSICAANSLVGRDKEPASLNQVPQLWPVLLLFDSSQYVQPIVVGRDEGPSSLNQVTQLWPVLLLI